MLPLVSAFGRLGEENAFAVLARATELARSGRDIINLGIGQPDFPTPAHIVEAGIQALRDGHHGYTPATGILAGLATGVAAAVTIFVLSFLMVLEGPKIVESGLNLLDPDRRERVRHVGHDCAKSITGYITGVLAIAAICGVSSYIVLKIAGVPFAGLIALFVALCDLIPLIGATLGAVVAVGFAFVESSTAGIIVLIFFFVYQQLENHLLQPMIQSRTVKVNALTVIISILIGVELMGILGALLAIPVASMIQVIVRDVWDHRRGQLKTEPTVGEDRTPVAESVAEEAAARPVAVGR